MTIGAGLLVYAAACNEHKPAFTLPNGLTSPGAGAYRAAPRPGGKRAARPIVSAGSIWTASDWGRKRCWSRSSDLRRRPRGSSGPSGGQIGTAVVDIRRFFLDLPFSEAFSGRRDGPAAGNHPGDDDVIARPSNRVSHVRRLLTASMAGWTRRNAPVESDPRQGNGAGRLDTSSLNRTLPSRPVNQPTMAYSSLIFHAKSSIIIQLYKDFLNPTG